MSLERASHFQRAPIFGLPVDTRALCTRGGLALVFLGAARSLRTRAAVRSLQRIHEPLELADVALVGVVRGPRRAALELITGERLVFPVLHDPEAQLFEDWELCRGRLGWRHGAFVVGPQSRIRWRWCPRSPVARLDVVALQSAALALR